MINKKIMEILRVDNLSKIYNSGKNKVCALKNVDFSVSKWEFVAIIWESGSGKSTLLNMVWWLDLPTSGNVYINWNNISKMDDDELTIFRRRNIWFVFQNFNLISELNVEQNIIFPSVLDHKKPKKEYVENLLIDLWLSERRNHLPSELSGWQQQRVAIWRALIMKPFLILADEPTWNLDSKNSSEIINLFKETSKKYNQTILMITHSQIVAKSADRILRVSDWKLSEI